MPNIINLPLSSTFNDSPYSIGASLSQPDKCMAVPFYITWTNVTTTRPGYRFQLPDQPNMIRRIAGFYVDNTRCSEGIYIICPDTGFRIVVSPYKRGWYPAITQAVDFYIGILNPAGANAADNTTVMALNFLVPPFEQEEFISSAHFSENANAGATIGSTLLNPLVSGAVFTGNYRIRSVYVQLANMTATAAGFVSTFTLSADGVVIVKADLGLVANEVVDANMLVSRDTMKQSARQFTWTWTIVAGALVGGAGAGSINIDSSMDIANVT